MSQVIRKLKFEVDVALIYVCKAFWREVSTPAHQRHCQDSSKVKPRPSIPGPVGSGVSNDWCMLQLQLCAYVEYVGCWPCWCLGKVVFRDCGISWIYSHIFFSVIPKKIKIKAALWWSTGDFFTAATRHLLCHLGSCGFLLLFGDLEGP